MERDIPTRIPIPHIAHIRGLILALALALALGRILTLILALCHLIALHRPTRDLHIARHIVRRIGRFLILHIGLLVDLDLQIDLHLASLDRDLHTGLHIFHPRTPGDPIRLIALDLLTEFILVTTPTTPNLTTSLPDGPDEDLTFPMTKIRCRGGEEMTGCIGGDLYLAEANQYST